MPKANPEIARELARLSSDCSFLLTHLIRQNDGRSDGESKIILSTILGTGDKHPEPLLKASPVGWYSVAHANIYNPISGKFNAPNNDSAVCFTESTLAGLKAHRDVFGTKYGIAFDRDLLFGRGANPCLNVRESVLKESVMLPDENYSRYVYNFIPHQLHPFINVIHESFDATHEREWRHVGDMQFEYADVMFVFCPTDDFEDFSVVQSSGRPVLFDLAWLDRV